MPPVGSPGTLGAMALGGDQSYFKQIFESSPDPSWIIEGNHVVECNEAAISTMGYPSRDELLNVHPSKLSPPRQADGEDSYVKAERMTAIAKDKGPHRFEWIHTKANGTDFVAEVTLSAIQLPGRQVICCIWRDITERKRAEQMLRTSEERLQRAQSLAHIGNWDWNIQTGGLHWEKENYRIFGLPPETIPSLDRFLGTVHPDDLESLKQAISDALERQEPYDMDMRIRRPDGTERVVHAFAEVDRDADGTPLRFFGTVQDITERKQMEELVRQMAFHDTLTQLPNRRMLNDRLSQSMAASKRSGIFGALMFLDLDEFKLLNDTHGHTVGDLLLTEAAKRLKSCVREVDTVARFGGDEFVVMISGLSVDRSEATAQARIIAEKIGTALGEPYVLKLQRDGQAATTVEHSCTASIGVALFGKNETSQEDILKQADMAMYQAKEAGSNSIRFYELRS